MYRRKMALLSALISGATLFQTVVCNVPDFDELFDDLFDDDDGFIIIEDDDCCDDGFFFDVFFDDCC